MKAVIFDLDETLLVLPVDWKKVKSELDEYARKNNIPIQDDITLLSNKISSLGKEHKKAVDEIYLKYESTYVEEKEIFVYPKTKKFLEQLKEKGVVMAIASNNCRETIKKALEKTGLKKYFQLWVGRNDVEMPKPSPEMLNKICEKLKIKKEDVIFIGNSIYDEEAGKKVGIKTFIIQNGNFEKLSPVV